MECDPRPINVCAADVPRLMRESGKFCTGRRPGHRTLKSGRSQEELFMVSTAVSNPGPSADQSGRRMGWHYTLSALTADGHVLQDVRDLVRDPASCTRLLNLVRDRAPAQGIVNLVPKPMCGHKVGTFDI